MAARGAGAERGDHRGDGTDGGDGRVPGAPICQACAAALDKFRINPGNVGTGRRRDEQFSTICAVARDHGKPVRIGVNGGSLNQELVVAKMQDNTDRDLGRTSEAIINECMVISALESTSLALDSGLGENQIIISAKVSRPPGSRLRLPGAGGTDVAAAASRTDRGGHGDEGTRVVGVGHGHPAPPGYRGHDPGLADAAPERRPQGRGLRRVRTPASARPEVVCPEHHRLSRLRADHPAPRFRNWPSVSRTTCEA